MSWDFGRELRPSVCRLKVNALYNQMKAQLKSVSFTDFSFFVDLIRFDFVLNEILAQLKSVLQICLFVDLIRFDFVLN